MAFIKSCSIDSRNEQSPTCEVVHETNKAHFGNLLPNRFLPSSVGKALAWRSGGPGFNPHWGQFCRIFFFALPCVKICQIIWQKRLSWKTQVLLFLKSVPDVTSQLQRHFMNVPSDCVISLETYFKRTKSHSRRRCQICLVIFRTEVVTIAWCRILKDRDVMIVSMGGVCIRSVSCLTFTGCFSNLLLIHTTLAKNGSGWSLEV